MRYQVQLDEIPDGMKDQIGGDDFDPDEDFIWSNGDLQINYLNLKFNFWLKNNIISKIKKNMTTFYF